MKRFAEMFIALMACCAAFRASAGTAKNLVLEYLRENGIAEGVNFATGEIIAIGSAEWPVEGPDGVSVQMRDKYRKVASLMARGDILQTILTSSSASRVAHFKHDGTCAEKDAASACEAFSKRALSGWRVLFAHECQEGGRYSVAVAVSWNLAGEQVLASVKAGNFIPARRWKEELLAYIKSQDLSTWGDVGVFVDSTGFPHVLGIGLAEWSEDPRMRDVAMRRADMFAQKNLLLGLYGDAAIFEAAGKLRKNAYAQSGEEVSQLKFYEALSEVEVSITPPPGCRLFYTAPVENPISGRKATISIFSFEPNGEVWSGTTDGTAGVPKAPGVMIWNPSTGKYEKQ